MNKFVHKPSSGAHCGSKPKTPLYWLAMILGPCTPCISVNIVAVIQCRKMIQPLGPESVASQDYIDLFHKE